MASTSAQVRAWARTHGYEVSDRGRLPGDVVAAWQAAQSAPRVPAPRTATRGGDRLAAVERAVADAEDRVRALERARRDDAERLRLVEEQVDALTVRVTALDRGGRRRVRRRQA